LWKNQRAKLNTGRQGSEDFGGGMADSPLIFVPSEINAVRSDLPEGYSFRD